MDAVWRALFAASLVCLASAQSCTRPAAPANGAVSRGSFGDNATLTFTCNSGFQLVGSATTTCQDGTPSSAPPTCTDIDECTGSPCRNSGTCTNTVGGFTCVCPSSQLGGALCDRFCDGDQDCLPSQFCMGGSANSQVARASSFDLITSALSSESQELPYQVPVSSSPPVASALTIFGKVRQEVDNNGWVVAKGQDTLERDYGLYLRGSANQMWFIFNPSDRTNIIAENQPWQAVVKQDLAIDDNQWHTVAVTFDPAKGRVEFFIDGELRAVEVEDMAPNYRLASATSLLFVGGRAGGQEFTLQGSVEIARVYSVALTEVQVQEAHRQAMLPATRLCTDYQTADQPCHLCSEIANCTLRCGDGLYCVGYGPDPSVAVEAPVNGMAYSTGELLGVCKAACPSCSTETDSQMVCGTNGVSYENDCFAMCAGTETLHNGTCATYESLAVQLGL